MKKLQGKYYYSSPNYSSIGSKCKPSMYSGVIDKDLEYVIKNYTKFVCGCNICHSSDGKIVDRSYTLKEAERVLKIKDL